MAVSCKLKNLQVKQLSRVMQGNRREFDSPDMFHPENALAILYMAGMDFIHPNYFIFLLKLQEFKNYSSTFNITAKHVDIYIVRGTKCARVLLTFLLLLCYF